MVPSTIVSVHIFQSFCRGGQRDGVEGGDADQGEGQGRAQAQSADGQGVETHLGAQRRTFDERQLEEKSGQRPSCLIRFSHLIDLMVCLKGLGPMIV